MAVELDFDSSKSAQSKTSFPFYTGGELAALELGEVDCYDGIVGRTSIHSNHDINIVLETSDFEYNKLTLNFEFKIDYPLVFNHVGYDVIFDLDTSPQPSHLQYNLTYVTNGFEFNALDEQSYVFTGAVVDLDLTTERRAGWNNINVPLVPITDRFNFELGHDTIELIPGTGGFVNPTGYDLSASPLPVDENGYDLVFYPAEDKTNKSNSWDFVAAFSAISAHVELETDRLVTDNDIEVCGYATGATVVQTIQHRELLPTTGFNFDQTILDNDLEFRFDNGIGACTNDMLLGGMISGANSRVGLTTARNMNTDILICVSDLNPPLNIDTHNFLFEKEYLQKDCSSLIVTVYAGATSNATMVADSVINSIDGYSGATLGTELSTIAHFDAPVNTAQTLIAILTNNPADEFASVVNAGSYVDLDLYTVIVFNDMTVDNGAYSDLDLTDFPPAELDMDVDHGAHNEITLSTFPVLQMETAYYGAYGDLELTDFPTIEMEMDAHGGGYGDLDLNTYSIFDMDAHGGAYGDLDLLIFASEGLGVFNNYTGGECAFDMAVTSTFNADGYDGSYGDFDLSTSTTMSVDGYEGGYVDADLTEVLPYELDMDSHHGAVMPDMAMAVTFALFPRAYHGSYSELELNDYPAIEVSMDAYSGAAVAIDTLTESDFNTKSYHGATVEDILLQVTVNFVFDDIQFGSYVDADEVYRAPSFDVDAYAGLGGLSDLDVPLGESMVAIAYTGALFAGDIVAPIHAQLNLKPINAGIALYDGWGGVGGFNHCPTPADQLDPVHGDNVIRLGFDVTNQLNMSFDDIGVYPWTVCNAGGMHFAWELQTQQRLEAQAYNGEYSRADAPMTLMALFGNDVPLDRLYEWDYTAILITETFELEGIEYQTLGTVWDDPEDVTAFYEMYFDVELTLTAFAPMFGGANAVADFSTVVYAWKHAQKPFETGEHVRLEFEPVIYARFCKGYIIPNGNSVVFEYGTIEDSGCSIFIARDGALSHEISLFTLPNPEPRIDHGSYASASLTIDAPWSLYAYGGQKAHVDNPDISPGEIGTASYCEVTLYDAPTLGGHGANANVDTIVVPGPGIKWITEEQCLPNDYLPLTPDGDIDIIALLPNEHGVEEFPIVPVEHKKYFHALLATCISFDEVDDDGG